MPRAVVGAIVAAICFEFATQLPSGPVKIVLKVLPVATMAVWALSRRRDVGLLVGLSLCVHAVGDILIELPRKQWLIPAMSAFLVGHVLYITVFVRRAPERRVAGWATVAATLLILNAVGYGGWLTSRLSGPLSVAVPLYIAALTVMAVLAVRRDTGSVLPAIGGISFVVSDAMIAWRLFVMPDAAWLSLLTWPTYAAAQILIPLGIWHGTRARTTPAPC